MRRNRLEMRGWIILENSLLDGIEGEDERMRRKDYV
jgi:hypothetical protein